MSRRRRETAGNRDGRDQLGRFTIGCRPGPGRPEGSTDLRTVAKRSAEAKGTTLEAELAEVVDAVIEQAKAGDLRAAYLVFRHLADEDVGSRGKSLEQILAETAAQRPVLIVETGLPAQGGRP